MNWGKPPGLPTFPRDFAVASLSDVEAPAHCAISSRSCSGVDR